MDEPLTTDTEPVDDIPLLLHQLKLMDVQALLDKHFPTHKNWQGASLGQTTVIWLTQIVSEGDHRLNRVEDWVRDRLVTLRACTTADLRSLDLSDDRLARVLDYLSDEAGWEAFEQDAGRHLIRTYTLEIQTNRVDSTTTKRYGTVTPDGLFQFGHSKDHRPDVPQVKIKLAALDPLGLPLVTLVVPGNCGDDPLYIPAIQRVQATLDQRHVTHIGDCKMSALSTRAYVQASGDYYVTPLSQVQLPLAEIEAHLKAVWSGQQPLTRIYRPKDAPTDRPEKIAAGYEWTETLTAQVDNQLVTWTERRLLVQSFKFAHAAEQALRARVAQAQAALEALNQRGRGRRRFTTVKAAQAAAEPLVQSYHVEDLLRVTYVPQVTRQHRRAYGQRPARTLIHRDVQLKVKVNHTALRQAIRLLGWRVYATNQPARTLSLTAAVLAYRGQFIEERCFGRLKGRALSSAPMYLASDQRVIGLIHLLSLALRVLALVEFQVRRGLQAAQEKLVGLSAGQRTRATARPTTERLLGAFAGIYLTIQRTRTGFHCHVSRLTDLQRHILKLLGFPLSIYSTLKKQSQKLAPKMGEP